MYRTRNTRGQPSRVATTHLLEMIEEGVLNKDDVIVALVNYMSESDVAAMCELEGYFDTETA